MSYRAAMLAGAALISVSAAGCAVGPDFERPAVPAVQGYTPEPLTARTAAADDPLGGAQHFDTGKDIQGEWWQLLHSPPLDALVAQALRANPTLTAAQAALRQAQENVAAQRGQYFPSVTAGLSASRNLTPVAALSPASATGNPYYSLITPQLNVSSVPDVFGANRRTVESLEAQAENQHFQLEATYLTLTSNVVAAAVQEASLRGQIAATEEIVKAETDLLDLRRQHDLGQVAGADVAAQEAALAQAHRRCRRCRSSWRSSATCWPRWPAASRARRSSRAFDLAGLQLPVDLPVSLPSKLVEQRPDVRAGGGEHAHAPAPRSALPWPTACRRSR